MGLESTSAKKSEQVESPETLGEKMKLQWEQTNGKVFTEAVGDAQTLEDVVAAIKTCAIKERREYDRGEKVVMHEHGSFHNANRVVSGVESYASAIERNDSSALNALSDEGIPEIVKKRLHEIVKPKEGQ